MFFTFNVYCDFARSAVPGVGCFANRLEAFWSSALVLSTTRGCARVAGVGDEVDGRTVVDIRRSSCAMRLKYLDILWF